MPPTVGGLLSFRNSNIRASTRATQHDDPPSFAYFGANTDYNSTDEAANHGDGDDSDAEGEEFMYHLRARRKKSICRDDGIDYDDDDDDDDDEYVPPNAVQTAVFEHQEETEARKNPHQVQYPKVPDDYVPRRPCTGKGEPPFDEVDNPGNWNPFCYLPVFVNNKYAYHQLPTECRPVPADNNTGKRIEGGYEFFYNGEFNQANYSNIFPNPFRSGATIKNNFPECRTSSLDANKLRAHGLTKERMDDPLFFYQLLAPICDPKKSGIKVMDVPCDGRQALYTNINSWSNSYAALKGLTNGYGHNFKPVEIQELPNFDGVWVRDGALGGSQGNIHIRFLDSKLPVFHNIVMFLLP
jgi:hypothetical protein